MSHYIAIIYGRELSQYDSYHDDYSTMKIVESITDWEEVTDEEFKILRFQSSRMNYSIIVRPTDTKKFIAKTIADYLAVAKVEEEKAVKEKKEREDAALARKFKKELKDRASKEKMLAKLVQELGPEAVTAVIGEPPEPRDPRGSRN